MAAILERRVKSLRRENRFYDGVAESCSEMRGISGDVIVRWVLAESDDGPAAAVATDEKGEVVGGFVIGAVNSAE